MGRENDGIAGFQCDQGFIAHGGGGIGAGHDGRDDPHGHADLPELMFPILPQQSYRLHPPHRSSNCLRCKAVFYGLIRHIAKACLLYRHLGQRRGIGGKRGGNGLYNSIQLFLGHLSQNLLSLGGLFRHCPGLLPGQQILVQFHSSSLEIEIIVYGSTIS